MNWISRLYEKVEIKYINPVRVRGKTKIFCIGRNKTGTTSLRKEFRRLGFIVGHQRTAERLLPNYSEGNYGPIIKYCKSAQVFQDFPFSFPNTFRHLDQAFPGAKFILTVRDSPEVWYDSLIRFYAKLFGGGSVPTAEQMKNADYVWKGYIWETNRINYNTSENNPLQKNLLIQNYISHIEDVKNYFKDRPEDLLVINLGAEGAYQKFLDFLQVDSAFEDFPWVNKNIIQEKTQ